MRIALIAPEKLPVPPVGGGPVEITIYELARRLQERHQVTVFCPSDPSLAEDESWKNLRYSRLAHQSHDQYLEALMRRIAADAFDVIHIFDRPQFVLSLAPRLGTTKIVLHLHSDLLTREINGAEASACLNQISMAVVNSHWLRLHTAQHIPRFYAMSRVIKPGVDLGQFTPVWERGQERLHTREQLRLAGKRIVIYGGGCTSTEGPHILLNALRPLMRQDPMLIFMVMSDSWYVEPTGTPYSRELAQLGQSFKKQIFFTGSLALAEIPTAYQIADLLVCPAQWEEPEGRAVLEAMATGLPVVASARGVIPEMVRHGETGLLVYKHTEPSGFTKAIDFLIGNPALAADLGRHGRGVVETEYRWDDAVEMIEEIYAQVMT
ncbi:MAG: glycosyltransferase family 4 protein [Bacillota bacterium]